VIQSDSTAVILRRDDKYCAYAPDGDQRSRQRPHDGYCYFHIGRKLGEALNTPLTDGELKELKSTLTAGK
jgi:hypothetical protein